MTTVTFNFRTQNAESVRREIQRTLDATRQGQRAVQGQSQQAAQRSASAEQAATRAVLTEAAKRTQARQQEVAAARTTEQQITAAVLSEDRKRTSAGSASQRARIRSLSEYVNAARAAEQQVTRAQQQEQRRRSNAWGQRASSAVSGAIGVGSTLHGQIQDARERRASRETAANTMLTQTGASRDERERNRGIIENFVRDNHMNMDSVLEAMGAAQSRHNALGGATESERTLALTQTLQDVRMANNVDPNNLGGIPMFSAMLRQQGVSNDMRSEIMRNVTGISFSGSVETEQAIQQGLPAMLNSMSRTLATAGAGANRDALIRDSVVDFMAQVQTSAASGGRVTVSGNRMNTLRTALNNADTQNRMGNALARRSMNEEQRAVFNRSFTRGRDGRYAMAEALRNSPSEAAAVFGQLFGNDPTAVMNFLGVRGGGGKRQLLNRPEAGLLTSYFGSGQDSQGRTVRQYEAVRDLARQTITPERMKDMESMRWGEDRALLNDQDNARSAAMGDNTSALNRLSNVLSSFQAEHPVLAAVLGAGAATAVPSVANKVAGAVAGGTVAAPAGGGGGGVFASGGRFLLRAGARIAGSAAALSELLRPGNEDQGYFDDAAALRAHQSGASSTQINASAQRGSMTELLEGMQRAVRDGAREGVSMKSPQAEVHAATQLGTANGLTAEQRANRM